MPTAPATASGVVQIIRLNGGDADETVTIQSYGGNTRLLVPERAFQFPGAFSCQPVPASVSTADLDWAEEIRQFLAQPASQEIIVRNNSHIQDVTMRISGSGHQCIESDNSTLTGVNMTIE